MEEEGGEDGSAVGTTTFLPAQPADWMRKAATVKTDTIVVSLLFCINRRCRGHGRRKISFSPVIVIFFLEKFVMKMLPEFVP